jgi:hypothetical protein
MKEGTLKRLNRISLILAATCLSAGAVFSIGLLLDGPTRAQTTTDEPAAAEPMEPAAEPMEEAAEMEAEPTGLPFDQVPFYAEWASSPHADRTAEAFNHWNEEGAVEVDCARCHSTPGFVDFVGADGTAAGVVDHPAPTGTVITCTACHNSKTLVLSSVTFPSGLQVGNLGAEAICMTCHQGREAGSDVAAATAGQGDDEVNPELSFINVHYRAAGATLYGTEAQGAFEYPGQDYAGKFEHKEPYNSCIGCHDTHSLEVKVADCSACHKEVNGGAASLQLIRMSSTDFDGSGDADEGIAQEVQNQAGKLLAAIQAYGSDVAGTPIAYDSHAYPYFFVDTNGNGEADGDEARYPNKYNAWTPRLLKAAYNYQFVLKDPGAFAHNPTYTLQILYDSLSDLGNQVTVDLEGATRP